MLAAVYGIISAAAVQAATICVDAGIRSGGDGSSWSRAYADLQTALSAAAPGDEIWVKAGAYRPHSSNREISFALKNDVEVFGGFAGTETDLSQRDWQNHPSILSGDIGRAGDNADNSYHVVRTDFGIKNSAVLDGFTVTKGNADKPDIEKRENKGGGMLNCGSPTVTNCIFSDNTARLGGGGMFCLGYATVVITDCIFKNNTGGNSGGGISSCATGTSISGCTFENNRSNMGGGVYT
jgi:hypothetical protein